MALDVNVINPDSISFYYKVSSETNYDFLHFIIDGNEQDKWSGEQGWTRKAYFVSNGEHSFKWSYTKDMSDSNGSDKAWVDYIVFPSMELMTATQQLSVISLDVNLYPNPVNHTAQLSFVNNKTQELNVQIFNQNGQIVLFSKSKTFTKGSQNMSFDLSSLSSGTYTIVLKGKDSVSSITFIKM
jgi:hypothetical protein